MPATTSTTATTSAEAERLRVQARQAMANGQLEAARQAHVALLEAAPGDLEAINFLAGLAMSQGRLPQARQWLQRALAVRPDDAATLTNLAVVQLQSGDPGEAEQALRTAIGHDPANHHARLYLGIALERQGDTRAAIAHYFKAIGSAQAQGQWTSAATTPAGLQDTVRHAMHLVRRERRQLLDAVMAPLHARFGRDDLVRVEQCLAGYLGEVPCAPPDPRQQPKFLYFPGLPAQPYLPRTRFPWHEALEAAAPALREELATLLDQQAQLEPFLGEPPPGMSAADLGGDAPRWDGFFFFRHGRRYDHNCARAPRTMAALEATTIVHIREHAPEALFSVLGPGSRIQPHSGVTNTRVVTHLPLVVPGRCGLRVAGQTHEWQRDHCITFDDTFVHEAWNDSEAIRVNLLFDVWNPYLGEAERAALTELVAAIGDLDAEAP